MSGEFLGSENNLLAIGLMSGTSLDGIDVSLIETDGIGFVKHISNSSYDYDKLIKREIKTAIFQAISLRNKNSISVDQRQLEVKLTKIHAKLVNEFLNINDINKNTIDVIGFHGQTICHAPDEQFTWQIGDGALLAELTGIDTVNNFRRLDMVYGGQGAPLTPLYHLAIFNSKGIKTPTAFLNIGGVSNITYIGSGGDGCIMAFDTGPGNALLDDWILRHFDKPYDEFGDISASGRVDKKMLNDLLKSDYFKLPPPKSLDRESFDVRQVLSLNPQDGAATLTSFTVNSIKSALDHLPENPTKCYVTGGGRHNNFIMSLLGKELEVDIRKIDELGFDGDFLEAEAFAYLAVRALKKLPLTLPEITGIDIPRTGGDFFKAPI